MTNAIAPRRGSSDYTRLDIKVLTPEEAIDSAQGAIAIGQSKLPFPKWVSISFLKTRFRASGLGASDHSIMKYREIAFEEIKEYQDICLARYPRYWQDLALEEQAKSAARKAGIEYPATKGVKPDKLPLTPRQAELLEEVAELMREWEDSLLVRDELNRRYQQP